MSVCYLKTDIHFKHKNGGEKDERKVVALRIIPLT